MHKRYLKYKAVKQLYNHKASTSNGGLKKIIIFSIEFQEGIDIFRYLSKLSLYHENKKSILSGIRNINVFFF